MKKVVLSLITAVVIFLVSAVYAQAGTVTVEVSDIKEIKGLISVGLYSGEKGFPDKGKEYKGKDVEVTAGTVACTFEDVPDGTFAVAVFHDSNSNGKLDKNFLGIPKEGYAFSNNASAIGAPAFKDASFEFTGSKTIKIKMEY